jgi:hypothetical protein
MDIFGRALCREHQEIERRTQEKSSQLEREEHPTVEQIPDEIGSGKLIDSDEIHLDSTTKRGGKSLSKRIALKMGKGVVKGVKKVADSSKKRSQNRKWKGTILRRMTMSQLKHLCFERNISTKKTILKEHSDDVYIEKRNCSKSELVSRLKKKAPLDATISSAKRNHINIREILVDIDRKKAEWKAKELKEKISISGSNLLLEIEKAIREFRPFRRYDKEFYYRDTLAKWLESKFSDTEIEVRSGSTIPDIVVKGIAIEVKGPTIYRDLISIPDKCIRYPQYFPNGLICVLFSVDVSKSRYEDWLKGMKDKFPEIIVIKI